MPNAKTIQKNVNDSIRSYELKVVLTPQGINIHQDPKNISVFEVISILDVIKQTHVAQFNTNLILATDSKPLNGTPSKPDISPFLQEQDE